MSLRDWADLGQAIGGLAALAALVPAVIGIWFVFIQLRGLRNAQDVSVALALFDRTSTDEFRSAADWIRTVDTSALTYETYLRSADTREKLGVLWYYFEFVGTLVDRGELRQDILFDQEGTLIAGVWDKSAALIEARRRERGAPQYMENFQLLRERFQVWAKSHPPKLTPTQPRGTTDYYRPSRPTGE